MTEKDWWARKVKPAWHNPAGGQVALKIQDAYNSGWPDVDCCFNGLVLKVELKYTPAVPKDPDKPLTFSKDKQGRKLVLSPNQVTFLLQWHQAGGHAFTFIGVGEESFMVPITNVMNSGMSLNELRRLSVVTSTTFKELLDIPARLRNLLS